MTREEIRGFCQGIAPTIRDTIEQAVTKLCEARIAPLEREIIELKSKGVRFMGVHQRAVSYRLGSLVTFDGALFAAVRDVAEGEVPKSSDGWQLCVKPGRDGREAR
jgi:hypothetical protein